MLHYPEVQYFSELQSCVDNASKPSNEAFTITMPDRHIPAAGRFFLFKTCKQCSPCAVLTQVAADACLPFFLVVACDLSPYTLQNA